MTLTPHPATDHFDAPVLLALQDLLGQLAVRMKPKQRERVRRELCEMADRLDHDGWADRVVKLRTPRPHSHMKQEDCAHANALRLLVATLL